VPLLSSRKSGGWDRRQLFGQGDPCLDYIASQLDPACAPGSWQPKTAYPIADPSTPNEKGLPGSCDCPAKDKDPIDLATGNVHAEFDDYTSAGSSNVLTFSRYDNSLGSGNTFATSLGPTWRNTYDRYLHIISASSVNAERQDGQVVTFTGSGNTWTSDSDVTLKLVGGGPSWTLTDVHDTVETYTTISSTEAVLSSVRFANGYQQTLQYDSSHNLQQVSDSLGRTLTFTYSSVGELLSVSAPDGLVITYGYVTGYLYASNGNFLGLQLLTTFHLNSVTYSTSRSTTQTYQYQAGNPWWALTGVLDEVGNPYTTIAYDRYGRGVSF